MKRRRITHDAIAVLDHDTFKAIFMAGLQDLMLSQMPVRRQARIRSIKARLRYLRHIERRLAQR
jgi:hypothetical protein